MQLVRLTIIVLLAISFTCSGDAAASQEEASISAHTRSTFDGIRKIVLRAAESMPEESYTFRPVETVRSFGQIVGHVADSQYGFCSTALGVANPLPRIEKTKTSKAELVAALREAFAWCDKAYAEATDASPRRVKFRGKEMPVTGLLNINNIHTIEHYGNLTTYLRMKGIVPPTSDPEVMKKLSE